MKKRSVRIAGHPTSISLEEEFWAALGAIAIARKVTVNQLIAEIDEARSNKNLSSAVRVFVLENSRSG